MLEWSVFSLPKDSLSAFPGGVGPPRCCALSSPALLHCTPPQSSSVSADTHRHTHTVSPFSFPFQDHLQGTAALSPCSPPRSQPDGLFLLFSPGWKRTVCEDLEWMLECEASVMWA